MNPDSGRVFALGEDLTGPAPVGSTFHPSTVDVPAFERIRALQTEELEAIREGAPLVMVSPEVAQAVTLGRRELDRRARRRKAAKQARKANR